MKAGRLSSWGLTAALLATVGCSSGGNGAGTGGHAGSTSTGTGGHAGMGGHAGSGTGGSPGGAGGASNGGSGGASNGGAGGTSNGGAGGTSNGGGGGTSNGGAGGAVQQSTNFSMSLTPSSAMVGQGAMQMVTVSINRNLSSTPFTGTIALALQGAPTGVTGTFAPTSITQGSASATLTLTVGSTVATGSYSLSVVGTSGSDVYTVSLPVMVTAPATLALVDDDHGENNDSSNTNPTPSDSDTDFANWLQGESITNYVTKVSQSDSSPTYTELQNYQTIIWYMGDSISFSSAKKQVIQDLIDAGGKTVIIFDENLYYDLGITGWASTTDTFAKNYIGATGVASDLNSNATSALVGNNNFVVTGAGSSFAGLTFQVIADIPINSDVDATNPATGTDVLVTTLGDPDASGTDVATPVVVGHKHAGTAGTSTVIYVGIPVENIQPGLNKNTAQQFFHAILVYAGLKSS